MGVHMAKYLVIVESPAKVKTIKKFLGANYEVMASQGHVRDLPKSQLGFDPEHDYEPKYITIRGKGDLLASLRKEVKKADKIYLATDPDREGEAISWHLYYALKLESKKVYRITFNEITKNAVKESLKNAREIDMNLVDAQQARRMLDRMVGYRISPLLWAKIKRGLSAGRVQSVALVQAEFADTVFLIELGQCSLHLLGRSVCAELFRQFTDAGTNSLIVHLALLHAAGIIFNDGKFRHMKLLHHGCKIKVIEFLENADVMQCRIVDGTDDLSADLAATAVAVLVIHQEIGQIAVPQIPVETVITCQIDQIMNALVKQCRHIFRVVIFVIVMGHEERHVIQQFSVLEITVYDQFFFSHMSNLLVLYVLTIQSQWAK